MGRILGSTPEHRCFPTRWQVAGPAAAKETFSGFSGPFSLPCRALADPGRYPTRVDCIGGDCEGKICNKYKAGCTHPPDNPASKQWTKLVLPAPVQMWNQEDVGKAVLNDDPFFCLYESKTDMVVLFNQSRDGKDTAQDQYGKITDFLKRAACSVTDWPEPLPPCPNPPCFGWVKP